MKQSAIEKQLYSYSKANIALEELEKILNCKTHQEKSDIISDLMSENIITPVKKKNFTDGKGLYLKYHINKPIVDNSDIINEIKHLEGSFSISYYLENINKYKKYREIILPLSDFLKTNSDKLQFRISKNERAYQIWNYEKALDSSNAKSVIEINNLRGKLNYYNTPEPFFYYTPEINRFNEKTVLIIENKDTWYSMREIMRSKNSSVNMLGHIIDGILYGEGKKVARENALADFCETELKHKCDFLYYGDLDYEGIAIFKALQKQSTDFDVQLFSEFYIKLIDLTSYQTLGSTKKGQQPIETDVFIKNFDVDYSAMINKILCSGKYIPQEAISKDVLDKMISEI